MFPIARSFRVFSGLGICVAANVIALAQADRLTPGPLTTVKQVRSLSAERAATSIPVHLSGVVTVPSTYKTSFFFLDSTAGISIDRADSGEAMRAGERVEIDGVTAPGLFAPVVLARRVKVVGFRKLPMPKVLRPDDLSDGRQDSQWIALRAFVRTATIQNVWGNPVLVLRAVIGSHVLINIQVRDYSKGGWDTLPGSVIEVRGACGSVFNDRRQFVGARMLVAGLDDLVVLQPAADPFMLPSRPLDQVYQFGGHTSIDSQVKMTGIVTEIREGESLVIQDGNHGILVRTFQRGLVPIGSRVEVVGYPALGDYAPILDDAIYRVVPGGRPIAPIRATAANMLIQNSRGFWTAPYNALLVQIDALVVAQTQDEVQDQLILRNGNVVFRAKLPHGTAQLPQLEPGTLVRVSAICGARVEEERNVQSFSLRLRSPADVVVLKKVEWWRTPLSGWIVALILSFCLVVTAAVVSVKRYLALHALAIRDELTRVYNRRGFLRLANRQWRNALRQRTGLLLFYLDINEFKQINDTFGHGVGDLVLKGVAGVLRECFRPGDIIARMGGDEFAILCTAHERSCSAITERLHQRMREFNREQKLGFDVDLSIGSLACDASLGDLCVEDLLVRSDVLMYDAKRTRKKTDPESLLQFPAASRVLR